MIIKHAMIFSFLLVFFVICSYSDELLLYSVISSSYPILRLTMGNIIFIFVRWSSHFISFYTSQFLPDLTSYQTSLFPVLHLLSIDQSLTSSFNDIILNYERKILKSATNLTFSDDVSFNC